MIEIDGKKYTEGDASYSDDPVVVWDTMADAVFVKFGVFKELDEDGTEWEYDICAIPLHEVKRANAEAAE